MKDTRDFSTSFFEDYAEQERRDYLCERIAYIVQGSSKAEPYTTNRIVIGEYDAPVNGIYDDRYNGGLHFIIEGNNQPLEFDRIKTADLEKILDYLMTDLPWWDKE